MSGVWTTGRIRQEIDRLADWRGRLTEALSFGASQLETVGLLPEDELLTDLTDYRQRMRSLATQLTGRPPATDTRLSLNLLEQQFQQSQQRNELVRQLDAIADLSHVDDPQYAPLVRCREDAVLCQHRLLSALTLGDDEQTRLFNREHPLQAVLALSDPSLDLSDDDWNRLQSVITKTYGRGLATALARGRIRRSVAAEPAAPEVIAPPAVADGLPSIHDLAGTPVRSAGALRPSVSAAPTGTSLHDPVATDLDTSTRWFLKGSSILPGVATTAPPADASVVELSQTTIGELPAEMNPPPLVIDLELPKPTWHHDSAAQLARAIAAEQPRTAVRLSDLVRQLIRDDRIALASHLARCGERLPSGRGMVPPSGLLRALALSRSLSYARGELAREVDLEMKPFTVLSRSSTCGDDELLGMGLLQRAAALLPALLGASPSASAVLRSFVIEPGLSHLYNYCSRVAVFGERLQSQAVELFQAPAEQSQWQAERKQLQSEVRNWLAQFVKRSVHYQRCAPLFLHAHWTVLASPTQRHPHEVMEWAKWQEVLLLSHRMLRPIWDSSADRNDVRVELSRATVLVQAESPESTMTKAANSRGLIPLTERMRDILLEAIDMANRWLRLQSATPTRGLHLTPHQAEELRAELLERTSGVISELDVIARTRSADIVQTGVCACRRVIEQIRKLCAGEAPLALHEPDAKHVLYGEFLKMPHVELDESWQPTAEAAEQERAILEHLSLGWTDWLAVFALQCSQEDHLATSRVLELPVWPDPGVLGELHRLRGQELHRTRQAVLRELDEIASQVALDVADRSELTQARGEIDQRLERLRAAIPQVMSFGKIRTRLDRYRDQWNRLVSGETPRSDRVETTSTDDSGILPALTAAVTEATEKAAAAPESDEQWVFLEE